MYYLRSKAWVGWLLYIPVFILFLLSQSNSLFFDTTQFAGRHPSFYLDTHFTRFFVPDEMDSGNPTYFGMYLALVWKILGKSLTVSHWAILPFILMLVQQSLILGKFFFPHRHFYAFLLSTSVLFQCSLITQTTLVSPDILGMAGFLWMLNALLKRKKMSLILAVIFMSMISLRTMMYSIVLYLFSLLIKNQNSTLSWRQYAWNQLLLFLPGGFLGLMFLISHYYVKGWVGYHEDSSWASSFTKVNAKSFLINCFYLAWRLIDLGNILSVLSLIILSPSIIKALKNQKKKMMLLKPLCGLVLLMILIIAIPLCFHAKLLTHRYLLTVNTSIIILVVYFLYHLKWKGSKYWILLIIFCQFSGHFWSYPYKVDQGWDSTLAHWPFYELRKEFIQFMDEQQIPYEQVGAGFILNIPFKYSDLTNSNASFANYRTTTTPYILYTNVNNDMYSTIDEYYRNYKILKYKRKGQVIMVLFQKKKINI